MSKLCPCWGHEILPSQNYGRLKEEGPDCNGARFGCHRVKKTTKGCVVAESGDSDCDANGDATAHLDNRVHLVTLHNPLKIFT